MGVYVYMNTSQDPPLPYPLSYPIGLPKALLQCVGALHIMKKGPKGSSSRLQPLKILWRAENPNWATIALVMLTPM